MATEFTLLTPIPHELYNRETEEVEAVEVITPAKASGRNLQLKRLGEPYRWVPVNPLLD
jgi:hypothetical protein